MTEPTIRRWLTRTWASPTVRTVVLTLYYIGILVGVAAVRANHYGAPTHFVYQEF